MKKIFKYLQKKFPRCYAQYCKIRYPNPWAIWCNLNGHIRILFRKILYKLHLDKYNPEMKKIQRWRNCHDGKRCFIVATGPSLRYEDLETIKGEYCFSANTIFLTYPYTSWRPDYYGIVDYLAYKEDISKYSAENFDDYAKEAIFLHYKIKTSQKSNKAISLLIHNGNHRRRILKKKFKQELELSICYYDCFTVTNMLIALAIYMGFKEIYLLGVDCDYSNEKAHIIETVADQKRKIDSNYLNPRTDLMIWGYKIMKQIAEKENCKIYNATRGGKLEIFKRRNLEDILKNNEINT